jgi:hypothetical protein
MTDTLCSREVVERQARCDLRFWLSIEEVTKELISRHFREALLRTRTVDPLLRT